MPEIIESEAYILQRRLPVGAREWEDFACSPDEAKIRSGWEFYRNLLPPSECFQGFGFRIVRRQMRDEVLCVASFGGNDSDATQPTPPPAAGQERELADGS